MHTYTSQVNLHVSDFSPHACHIHPYHVLHISIAYIHIYHRSSNVSFSPSTKRRRTHIGTHELQQGRVHTHTHTRHAYTHTHTHRRTQTPASARTYTHHILTYETHTHTHTHTHKLQHVHTLRQSQYHYRCLLSNSHSTTAVAYRVTVAVPVPLPELSHSTFSSHFLKVSETGRVTRHSYRHPIA